MEAWQGIPYMMPSAKTPRSHLYFPAGVKEGVVHVKVSVSASATEARVRRSNHEQREMLAPSNTGPINRVSPVFGIIFNTRFACPGMAYMLPVAGSSTPPRYLSWPGMCPPMREQAAFSVVCVPPCHRKPQYNQVIPG